MSDCGDSLGKPERELVESTFGLIDFFEAL